MRRKNILIVDDSSTIRTTVKVCLSIFESLEMRFAVDGYDALKQITERAPDMVIADVLMPRLNGYQLAALLKQSPKTFNIPFYLLTSKDGEVDKAMGRVRGVDGYIVKPFQRPEIQSLVSKILSLEDHKLAA